MAYTEKSVHLESLLIFVILNHSHLFFFCFVLYFHLAFYLLPNWYFVFLLHWRQLYLLHKKVTWITLMLNGRICQLMWGLDNSYIGHQIFLFYISGSWQGCDRCWTSPSQQSDLHLQWRRTIKTMATMRNTWKNLHVTQT